MNRLTITVVAALAVCLSLAGCTAGAAPRHDSAARGDRYGSFPGFLPKDTTHPDSVLAGSASDPAITSQGDEVRVNLGRGYATLSVSGPVVPGEGLPYQTPATTCTWTVTIAATNTTVPVSVSDFTSIDHLGALYRPRLVTGQPAPPALINPGRQVTFELRAVMATGEGLMRWAPDGRHVVGSWDFTVEND